MLQRNDRRIIARDKDKQTFSFISTTNNKEAAGNH